MSVSVFSVGLLNLTACFAKVGKKISRKPAKRGWVCQFPQKRTFSLFQSHDLPVSFFMNRALPITCGIQRAIHIGFEVHNPLGH